MSQQINLFDRDLLPNRQIITAKSVLLLAMLCVAGIAAAAMFAHQLAASKEAELAATQSRVKLTQDQLKALSAATTERKVSLIGLDALAKAKAQLQSRHDALSFLNASLPKGDAGFSEYMRAFSRQTQSDLWLSGFSVGMADADIQIRGRMLDPSRLPAYVLNLKNEQIFRGQHFAMLDVSGGESTAKPVEHSAAQSNPVLSPQVKPSPRVMSFVLTSARASTTAVSTPERMQ